MAARLVVVEVAQALKGFDHAHVFVHDDNRAGTQHRACFGNRVIVHIGLHHDIGRQHGRGRTAGNDSFEFFTAAHTACHFQDFGKRRTQWHFIVARTFNVAGNTEQFGTACIRNTFVGKRLSAVTDNEWNGGERFGIVDGGRFAVQAERGGEWRFEARLAFFAFQRFEQCGFFTANICAVAVVGEEFKFKIRTQNIFTQKTCSTRLGKCGLKALVAFENFAVNVVVARFRTHRVTGDNHAFNQGMGIEHDDVAVFKCTRLAFVGIADDVFFAREGTGHKAPFQTGREARTATTAQAGGFDLVNHIALRDVFGQDFTQGGITATFDVFVQCPAIGIGGIHLVKNHA